MARSRVPVAKVQLKSTAHKAVLHVETPVECPLCIETLDDTDRDFFPCPCGYQEQQQQQQQQGQLDRRASSGFTSVEVTTVVAGSRHSVCVPVSNHSEVAPFPEAATLLEMLQSAVNGSKLSSTEAAVQLVQCLRKLEADSQHKQQQAWLQQALANGNQSAGLWTDSGLPGVDFAGVGGLGSGIPAAVPARLQMLWAGSSGQQGSTQAAAAPAAAATAASAPGYGGSVNPPPGFGGLAGSRLLNGAYNPLSYADMGAAAASKGAAAAGAAPPGFNFSGLDSGLKQQQQQQQQQQQPIYRPWA
ncbi:hypothetical protein OEZ85_009666 [Tetradesmus obliquus]|uniref:Zinc finger RING-type eukaryotic domain-containing protein n=1 Tax=Tetradesmus obliquus TaxID=3088 RepID=A0ABY8U9S4_TETOB|nr:hypothetical protein OEZ85_009666 [Tetradesmus obliquus]